MLIIFETYEIDTKLIKLNSCSIKRIKKKNNNSLI